MTDVILLAFLQAFLPGFKQTKLVFSGLVEQSTLMLPFCLQLCCLTPHPSKKKKKKLGLFFLIFAKADYSDTYSWF